MLQYKYYFCTLYTKRAGRSLGSVLLLKCSLCRVLQLLDVVDRGELADGGLGSVVGVVIDHDLAALDLLLDCLVLCR